MVNFGAQESQSEQQDEKNPFSPVTKETQDTPPASDGAGASNGQSNLVFNRDAKGDAGTRPVGITNNLVIPGDLPSSGDNGSRQRVKDQGDVADNETQDTQLTESIANPETQNGQSTPFVLSDVHWSIWLVLIVAALGVSLWLGKKLFKQHGRSSRPRTKSSKFKPVTNRLKINSVQPVAIPSSNGNSKSTKPKRLVRKPVRRNSDPGGDFGTTVRETAAVGAAAGFADSDESENIYGDRHQVMALEPSNVAVLDEQVENDELTRPDLFDGEAKEAALKSNGSVATNGSLIANLTAEITSLKETIGDVKLDRNLRSQLETVKTELEWKNSLLEKSERLADDRETALGIAVQAQSDLREKVITLSAELDKLKAQVRELKERDQELQDELAAE